jgi:hypothetical protein
MADYDESSSKPNFTLSKVNKLTSPGDYQNSSQTIFSSTSQLGLSATAAATANAPSIANGLGSTTLGYSQPVAMKSVIDGQDTLRDVRATCWVPNVMSSVEQPAYHIRFYLTEDVPIPLANYKTYPAYYQAVQQLKQTTIAESGVTGLNITSLSINTLAAPNNVTRSMSALNLTLTIVEPMGVSFFDMIAEAAAELKISNFAKLFYYVDVRFIGYDNGQPNMNICKDFDNGGIWTYQVRIQNVAVDSNSAASTYTFEATPFNEHIYTTSDLKLPTTFQPSGSTVGEMLTSLATMLNEYDADLYAYNIKTYAFRTTPCQIDGKTADPSSWKVTPNDISFNYERSMAMGTIEGIDQKTPIKGTFPAGANINDVIETIIVSSDEAPRWAKDVPEQDKTIKDDKSARNCVIFRYEPTIEIVGFDPITSQYIETITFDILSYFTAQPVIEQDDVTNAKDPQYQVNQAIALTSAGYMCKRYDYMFTGLNTEVMNFDFKYNFNFEVALPKLSGYQNSHSSYADHALVRDDPKDIRAIQARNVALLAQQKGLQDKLAVLKQSTDATNAAIAAQGGKTTADQTKLLADNAALSAKYSDAVTTSQTAFKSIQQSVQTLKNKAGINSNLVSRLPTSRTQVKYAEDMIGAAEVPRFPISTKQSGDDPRKQVSGQIPESYSRDRSIYGAILDQLYVPMAESLQQITLTVRGDPYWLGTGNIERSIARTQSSLNGVVRDHLKPGVMSNRQVDFSYGDVLFLLTFKYPLTVGDDGAPVIKNNESFTGIYRVISIKHDFQDGQFKQEITAVRCQLMDAFKALGVKVIEIPATDKASDHQTVSQQATAQAAAKAPASNPASGFTATASNGTIVPIPDAPAYADIKPPLPPGMTG